MKKVSVLGILLSLILLLPFSLSQSSLNAGNLTDARVKDLVTNAESQRDQFLTEEVKLDGVVGGAFRMLFGVPEGQMSVQAFIVLLVLIGFAFFVILTTSEMMPIIKPSLRIPFSIIVTLLVGVSGGLYTGFLAIFNLTRDVKFFENKAMFVIVFLVGVVILFFLYSFLIVRPLGRMLHNERKATLEAIGFKTGLNASSEVKV